MDSQFLSDWEAMGTENGLVGESRRGSRPLQCLPVPVFIFSVSCLPFLSTSASGPCSCHDAQSLNTGANCIDHEPKILPLFKWLLSSHCHKDEKTNTVNVCACLFLCALCAYMQVCVCVLVHVHVEDRD